MTAARLAREQDRHADPQKGDGDAGGDLVESNLSAGRQLSQAGHIMPPNCTGIHTSSRYLQLNEWVIERFLDALRDEGHRACRIGADSAVYDR